MIKRKKEPRDMLEKKKQSKIGEGEREPIFPAHQAQAAMQFQ